MSKSDEIVCRDCGDLFVPDWSDTNEYRERCRTCEDLLDSEKENEG